MSRKPEPSFELKKIIWDVAATVGTGNLQAIIRQLDYELEKRRQEGAFFEDTPEERTVKRIIEKDINDLLPDIVVSKLPKHVWKLRKDYDAIERLAREVNKSWKESNKYTGAQSFPQVGSDYNLNRHYDDLAKVATTLADNMATILGFAEFLEESTPLDKYDAGVQGNIIIGGFVGIALDSGEVDCWNEDTSKLQAVNSLDAKCLLEHFNYRFPNMARFKDWAEANVLNITWDVVDTLYILARSKNFGVSPVKNREL